MKNDFESVINYRKKLDEQWEYLLTNYNKDVAVFLMEEYNIVDQWLVDNGYNTDGTKREKPPTNIDQEFFTNDKGEVLDFNRWNKILENLDKKLHSGDQHENL